MNNLREQLVKLGFQETPQKKKKIDHGAWKNEAKKRLLAAEDPLKEVMKLITEAHDLFKAQPGSGAWFRGFLRPLYDIKEYLDNHFEISRDELRRKIHGMW